MSSGYHHLGYDERVQIGVMIVSVRSRGVCLINRSLIPS